MMTLSAVIIGLAVIVGSNNAAKLKNEMCENLESYKEHDSVTCGTTALYDTQIAHHGCELADTYPTFNSTIYLTNDECSYNPDNLFHPEWSPHFDEVKNVLHIYFPLLGHQCLPEVVKYIVTLYGETVQKALVYIADKHQPCKIGHVEFELVKSGTYCYKVAPCTDIGSCDKVLLTMTAIVNVKHIDSWVPTIKFQHYSSRSLRVIIANLTYKNHQFCDCEVTLTCGNRSQFQQDANCKKLSDEIDLFYNSLEPEDCYIRIYFGECNAVFPEMKCLIETKRVGFDINDNSPSRTMPPTVDHRIYFTAGVIVIVLLVASLILIYMLQTRNKHHIPLPEEPESPTVSFSQRCDATRTRILLLYSNDSELFMDVMLSFRQLLATTCQVFDCFDPELLNDIWPNPVMWLNNLITEKHIKIILINTENAHRSWNSDKALIYPCPHAYDNLFRKGVQYLTENDNLVDYNRVFVVNIEKFYKDTQQIPTITTSRSYIIPIHLHLLLQHLELHVELQHEKKQPLLDSISKLQSAIE